MKRLFEIVNAVLVLVCFNALAVHAQSNSGSDYSRPTYYRIIYPFERMLSAAREGDVETVKSLVPKVTTADIERSLVEAATYGRVAVVRELLTLDGVNINARNKEGITALIGAATYGQVAVVKELLTWENVDVNARDEQGKTPLILAALNGHSAVVKELLKRDNIDVNAINTRDYTALFVAAKYGYTFIIRELLKREDVVNNRADCQRSIELARSRNHEDAARLIEEALQKSDAQLEAVISSQLNSSLSGK